MFGRSQRWKLDFRRRALPTLMRLFRRMFFRPALRAPRKTCLAVCSYRGPAAFMCRAASVFLPRVSFGMSVTVFDSRVGLAGRVKPSQLASLASSGALKFVYTHTCLIFINVLSMTVSQLQFKFCSCCSKRQNIETFSQAALS